MQVPNWQPPTLVQQKRLWSYLFPSSRLPGPKFDVPGYEFIPTYGNSECGRKTIHCSGSHSDVWITHNKNLTHAKPVRKLKIKSYILLF